MKVLALHLTPARGPQSTDAHVRARRTSQADGVPDAGSVFSRRIALMQIRAAVLEEFGAPLVVREVDLAEPRAGEVLVRLVACGVCHTDLYTASGADPSGLCADGARARGRGRRRAGRRGRHARSRSATTSSRSSRRSAASASTAKATARTSASRSAISRTRATCPTARRGSRRGGEPIRHFMGTSTFAEYTVMPEIALAKVNPEAPLEGARCSPAGSRPASAPRCTPRRSSRARRASSSAPAWSGSAP